MSIIIPRSVWKPRYANGFAVIGVDEWLKAGKEIWLHHSVTNPPGPDATLEEDCEHMRAFEAIGQSRFGGGISYTWITMPSGRVFQGHDLDRQGSHTYQRNNRSRAICLAGQYHINPLPQRMQNSVALLLRELDATIDGPHSAVYATDCPGEHARSRIGAMNTLALSGAPIGEPAPTKSMGADDMLIKKLTGSGANQFGLLSGGILSGVDDSQGWATQTAEKVGALGVPDAVWNDMVRKSALLEAAAAAQPEILSELKKLNAKPSA